jgi:hypothetical protein
VGRYLKLARRTIGTHCADVQSPAEPDDISNQHCRYESNEKNERSLSTTSVDGAPQRQMKTVAAWAAGVTLLAAMASHPDCPQHVWQQFLVEPRVSWTTGRRRPLCSAGREVPASEVRLRSAEFRRSEG